MSTLLDATPPVVPRRHETAYTVSQVMSRPPRAWANPDYDFGRDAATGWHPAKTVDEEIELAAAKIQHDLIIRARARMSPRNHTIDSLAAASGLDSSVLGKLLRGDRPLHLTHIAALERALGPIRPGVP